MEALRGSDGELIDKLVVLISKKTDTDLHRLYNAGLWITGFVGGPLADVVPVWPGETPKPGTLAALKQEQLRNVTPSEWIDLIAERLREVVAQDVSEAFLVEAVRDALTKTYEWLADVGEGERRKQEMRADLLERAEDREGLLRFQQEVAKRDPTFGELHLDQVADHLRDLAESAQLAPVDADQAAERWAQLEAWRTDVEGLLSEDVVRSWTIARASF